jgi:hypothetical protein
MIHVYRPTAWTNDITVVTVVAGSCPDFIINIMKHSSAFSRKEMISLEQEVSRNKLTTP